MDRIVRETGMLADNGFKEVYANSAINDDSEIAKLMEVFTKDTAYDYRRFPVTSSSKCRFKTTEEGVSEMCEVIERNRAEAKAEGKLETMKDLVKDGILTIKEAAARLGISEDLFKQKAML